jgi:hypothetical protein
MVQVSVEMFQLHIATAFHFFISNMAFGFVCAGMPSLQSWTTPAVDLLTACIFNPTNR